jgi:hypothetical protein
VLLLKLSDVFRISRQALSPQVYSSSFGASARVTCVAEISGVGVPTAESLKGRLQRDFGEGRIAQHNRPADRSVALRREKSGAVLT